MGNFGGGTPPHLFSDYLTGVCGHRGFSDDCAWLCVCLQVKAQDKTAVQAPKRKCAVCGEKLGSSWKKPLCAECIASLVKDDSTAECHKVLTSVRDELASTFSSFRGMMDRVQMPSPIYKASSAPSLAATPGVFEQEEEEAGGSTRSQASSQMDSASGSEVEEDSSRGARYKLSLEDVGELLNAIYETLEIREEPVQLSKHDQLYQGCSAQKTKVFPVHKSLIEAILQEWEQPEKRPFFAGSLKRRFPFEDNASQPWNKNPKLDAPLAKVSKRTDLAFDDLGCLKDPMDKRGEILLKRAWDASTIALKPALAATCVARNLECWLNQLQAHITAGTSRQQILKSFPLLMKAVGFLADASSESVKLAARSAALVNAARRSVWLKTWTGDAASKLKLCGLPFSGDHLFGPGLQEALERTQDKKKAFPERKKKDGNRKFFRGFKQNQKDDNRPKKHWANHKG